MICLFRLGACVLRGMMPMQYTGHIYADAVHYAMTNAMAASPSPAARVTGLRELLYDLAQSIPAAWQTATREVLEQRESSIDQIVHKLSIDLGYATEPIRYNVLSSVLLVALTIKQMTSAAQRTAAPRATALLAVRPN
jgi:hypothetical protein